MENEQSMNMVRRCLLLLLGCLFLMIMSGCEGGEKEPDPVLRSISTYIDVSGGGSISVSPSAGKVEDRIFSNIPGNSRCKPHF